MRKELTLAGTFILLAVLVLGGCGGDDTSELVGPEADPFLARMEVQLMGGVADPALESLTILTGYSADGYEDCMGALILESDAEERTRIIDEEFYAGFPDFVSRMGNGEDEELYVCVHFTGGTHTTSARESQWLVARQDEGLLPDLGGASISRVEARIEPLETDTPGIDPNGDGDWTDYSLRITYTFY